MCSPKKRKHNIPSGMPFLGISWTFWDAVEGRGAKCHILCMEIMTVEMFWQIQVLGICWHHQMIPSTFRMNEDN